jgi:hypothetical protein
VVRQPARLKAKPCRRRRTVRVILARRTRFVVIARFVPSGFAVQGVARLEVHDLLPSLAAVYGSARRSDDAEPYTTARNAQDRHGHIAVRQHNLLTEFSA